MQGHNLHPKHHTEPAFEKIDAASALEHEGVSGVQVDEEPVLDSKRKEGDGPYVRLDGFSQESGRFGGEVFSVGAGNLNQAGAGGDFRRKGKRGRQPELILHPCIEGRHVRCFDTLRFGQELIVACPDADGKGADRNVGQRKGPGESVSPVEYPPQAGEGHDIRGARLQVDIDRL